MIDVSGLLLLTSTNLYSQFLVSHPMIINRQSYSLCLYINLKCFSFEIPYNFN